MHDSVCQNAVHWQQNFLSDRFCMYDYGSPLANKKHYGQIEPPTYSLKAIDSLPIGIYAGDVDGTPPLPFLFQSSLSFRFVADFPSFVWNWRSNSFASWIAIVVYRLSPTLSWLRSFGMSTCVPQGSGGEKRSQGAGESVIHELDMPSEKLLRDQFLWQPFPLVSSSSALICLLGFCVGRRCSNEALSFCDQYHQKIFSCLMGACVIIRRRNQLSIDYFSFQCSALIIVHLWCAWPPFANDLKLEGWNWGVKATSPAPRETDECEEGTVRRW